MEVVAMSGGDDTHAALAAVQADIARIAAEQPVAVLIAAIEVLLEVAAGDNYKKLQLYRGMRSMLAKRGIR